jgi:hypothetical protein
MDPGSASGPSQIERENDRLIVSLDRCDAQHLRPGNA